MTPTDPLDPASLEARARRRVARKMGFFTHAGVYLIVNLGLVAVDLVGGGRTWAQFPLLGWGLGLAIHGVVTFAASWGDGLRSRLLQRERQSLRRGAGGP